MIIIDNIGIIPRAIYELFSILKSKNSLEYKYKLSVTYLELYNEDLNDLLNPKIKQLSNTNINPTSVNMNANTTSLQIREDANGIINWYGVTEIDVESPEDLLNLLEKGSLIRSTGSTDMNMSSSRSHAIFSINLKQEILQENDIQINISNKKNEENLNNFKKNKENDNGEINNNNNNNNNNNSSNNNNNCYNNKNDSDNDNDNDDYNNNNENDNNSNNYSNNYSNNNKEKWICLMSKFHFVDLAGSERLKRTGAIGERVKEGITINQGLFALGNVINALTDETHPDRHIPYRDSKLTRLLQDSLGGNSKTLMLSCISCCELDYNESLNTLRYASRARMIKNEAVINRNYKNVEVNFEEFLKIKEENERLKSEIVKLKYKQNNEENIDFRKTNSCDINNNNNNNNNNNKNNNLNSKMINRDKSFNENSRIFDNHKSYNMNKQTNINDNSYSINNDKSLNLNENFFNLDIDTQINNDIIEIKDKKKQNDLLKEKVLNQQCEIEQLNLKIIFYESQMCDLKNEIVKAEVERDSLILNLKLRNYESDDIKDDIKEKIDRIIGSSKIFSDNDENNNENDKTEKEEKKEDIENRFIIEYIKKIENLREKCMNLEKDLSIQYLINNQSLSKFSMYHDIIMGIDECCSQKKIAPVIDKAREEIQKQIEMVEKKKRDYQNLKLKRDNSDDKKDSSEEVI